MQPIRRKNPINSKPPTVNVAALIVATGLRTMWSSSSGANLPTQSVRFADVGMGFEFRLSRRRP
jgi:hypothetical protein